MLRKQILMLFVVFGFMICSHAYAESSDYETNWAAKEISKWQSSGIVSGYPDGNFRPDAPITRAEFFKLIAETMGLTTTVETHFKDVEAEAWYTDYIAKTVAAGYVQGDDQFQVRPNDPITRQEVAKVLSLAFHVQTATAGLSNFKDAIDIADWSRGYVGGLAQAGYIAGYDDQSFKPTKQITRAESVKMFDNLAGELFVRSDTYVDVEVPGNALINKKGVTLQNVKIKGNLYIIAGVGEGNAHLDDMSVAGEVVIAGEDISLTISGNTTIKNIRIAAESVKINGQTINKGSVVRVEDGKVIVITTPTTPTNPTNPSTPSDSTGTTGPSGPSSGGDSTVHVNGVSLNQNTASMKSGEMLTLVATIAPANADNKNVRWSSSNEAIATVENGKITAQATGSAVITVTTSDGNYLASCTVTVTQQDTHETIYNVTATVNALNQQVTLEGLVASGNGEIVAVRVTDPQGNVDWVGQMAIDSEGKFSFNFTPNSKIQGEFTAVLGTNKIVVPIIVRFKYMTE